MRFLSLLLPATCISLSWGIGALGAAEEWADAKLKVQAGLELWLDASRLPQAAQYFRQPAINNRDPLETWFDASGHRRHARQVNPAFRPIYRDDLAARSASKGKAAVLFDGLDDRLHISGVGKDLQDITIFIVGSPQTMAGNFSALMSLGETGKNDYQTGINIDVGHEIRRRFDRLNVEGKGFGGEANLMSVDLGLGTFPILTVTSTPGDEGTRLYVDGKHSGQRARTGGPLRMDEIRIGSRYYIYNSPAAIEQGFFHGAIAEILVYGRLLSDQERAQVEEYLKTKYADLRNLKGLDSQIPIHLLQPGFTVRELPVHLTNINALAYSPDGRLFALGYDGRIHVLRDTDGDGLEDKAEVFWDKPTLRTPLAMAWRPEGLYVVSNGKISLFRESEAREGEVPAEPTGKTGSAGASRKGPDKKVTEEVVVTGWAKDDGNTGGGVDALGLAFDKDNNLFFGLGCADYSNAYRVKDGKAHYDLSSERGTILMVGPDRKRRYTVCTGIRFPVGLAFNKHGDLFCTDQEGETWLPGGNPLDELNHIVWKKHYGFPPLNAEVRPELEFASKIGGIRDEPPVVAFGPQHQSTCGLVFNEAAAGRPAFGPALWEDEALVAGFSRGKIWRVQLVETPTGYVGQPTLIAACQMLTLNLAISPSGDLLVACHSGLPDWGTGPSGPARLFKISYVNRSAPQPVAAWSAGPMEVRVAFDRPAKENEIDGGQAQIVFGEYVRAADRFEVLKPPYKAVQEQGQYPRTSLRVASARWSTDRRTLSLITDPPSYRATYALTLPLSGGVARPGGERVGQALLPGSQTRVSGPPTTASRRATQQEDWPAESEAAIDLAYTLNGVEARWKNDKGQETWTGWLPHLDLEVSRALTKGSADHERLFKLLDQPGELSLTTRIVLPSPIRRQGYLQGPESIVLAIRCCDGFMIRDEADTQRLTSADQEKELRLIHSSARPLVTIKIATGKDRRHCVVFYQPDQNQPPRPLPLDWQMLPWAPLQASVPAAPSPPAPELAGGDWKRGEAVFLSQEANCSACHALRGKGGKIGPDLSNLVFRDAASVLRDIVDPSAVINPDFVPFTVQLKNGRFLSGIPRAEKDGVVRVYDTDAKETLVQQKDIERLDPSSVSIMPKGYAEKLGQEKLRDLLTYLTNPPPNDPPAPAQDGQQARPPLRRRAEVEAILRGKSDAKTQKSPDENKLRTLNVVLVAGPKDHGPGEHDYPAWQRRWKDLLEKVPAVRVSTAWEWPQQAHWDLADVIVFYFWNHDWNEERYKQLDSFLKRGGGVVALHSASIADQEPEKLAKRFGLAFQPGRSKYRHASLKLKFNSLLPETWEGFSITSGLTSVDFLDESYWPMIGDVSRVNVLATTEEEGKSWPMIWTFRPSASGTTVYSSEKATLTVFGDVNVPGRVFGCILGHYSWTFDDPIFRIVFLRGLAWTAECSFDRFAPLVTDGVKFQKDKP